MSLSQKLKSLRADRNMTQKELARKMNVARTTVTGYETKNRQPSHEKLTVIAGIFEVTVDYLIDDKEDSLIPSMTLNVQQEHVIDRRVMATYRKLSMVSKEDVLKYVQKLEYWEQGHSRSDSGKG